MISKIDETLTFTRPERPKPEDFCYTHVLQPFDLEVLRRDRGYMQKIKAAIAERLAEHIVDKSQAFALPSYPDILRGHPIRIHVVINDRGAFTNWLPRERAEGEAAGHKRTLQNLPYGTNPLEYWE